VTYGRTRLTGTSIPDGPPRLRAAAYRIRTLSIILREKQAVSGSGCCIGIAGWMYGRAVSGRVCGEAVREGWTVSARRRRRSSPFRRRRPPTRARPPSARSQRSRPPGSPPVRPSPLLRRGRRCPVLGSPGGPRNHRFRRILRSSQSWTLVVAKPLGSTFPSAAKKRNSASLSRASRKSRRKSPIGSVRNALSLPSCSTKVSFGVPWP
jgi:hypothetical protein